MQFEMKDIMDGIDGVKSSTEAKFAQYDSQIAELKRALVPAAASVDDAEVKDFVNYIRTGVKAASNTGVQHNASEVAVPKYTGIYDKMRADNRILDIVNTINVSGYTAAAIPVDVSEPAVNAVAEAGSISETAPSIDIKTIPLEKLIAKVGLTYEMMNATAVEDMYSYIARKTADSLGRTAAARLTSNILANAGLTTVNAAGAAPAVGDLFDMMGAVVDKANNNGKFVMNSQTFYALAKSVGTSANWFTMPYTQGVAPTMFGHEVVFNAAMPNVASTKVPILYGDFEHAVTEVNAGTITTMRDDFTGADSGVVYLRTFQLAGGDLVRPEAVVGLKF